MIYLDYSATTPINSDVLESYNKVCKDYYGDPKSNNSFGLKSRELIDDATKQIASLLHIKENEIIFTSSGTEANNIAIINACTENKRNGQHIIFSKLECSSMYEIASYLEKNGYEIDYVNNHSDGLIDLEHLKKIIRKDTLLISICGVNNEVGIRQPLKLIRQVIKKENSQIIFHADLTQAVGKININLADVDLASFSGHKFFGPTGIGMIYKNEKIKISSFNIGSVKENINGEYPSTSLIVAFSKALRIALEDLNKKEEYVKKINEKICNVLLNYQDIKINKTNLSIPHILNISLPKNKIELFLKELEDEEIVVASNYYFDKKISNGVYALTNDKKLASSTIRISLSYITKNEEVNTFLIHFDQIYKKIEKILEE